MLCMFYIHSAPDSAAVGKTGSHGRVRTRNQDVTELFDLIPGHTPVEVSA